MMPDLLGECYDFLLEFTAPERGNYFRGGRQGELGYELRIELETRVRKLVPDAVVTVSVKAPNGNRVFVIGKVVKGGHYGEVPSLTDLDNGNLRYTTDFRRVYATLIKDWMGYPNVGSVLRQEFQTIAMFA